jgi:hypothetical protein
MSKSLSPEAIEALRRLNEVGVGRAPPSLAATIAGELLSAGLAAETGAGAGAVEITCDGRKYLSGDCD